MAHITSCDIVNILSFHYNYFLVIIHDEVMFMMKCHFDDSECLVKVMLTIMDYV